MQAKKIFQSICGMDEEFLPAIPNPEDIIMDDLLAAEEPGNNSGIGTIPDDEEAHDSPGNADSSDHTHSGSDGGTDEGVSAESVSITGDDRDMGGNTSGFDHTHTGSDGGTDRGVSTESVSSTGDDRDMGGNTGAIDHTHTGSNAERGAYEGVCTESVSSTDADKTTGDS
jgi:hypothetical protein